MEGEKLKRKKSLREGERGKEKERKENTEVQGHYICYTQKFELKLKNCTKNFITLDNEL